MRVAEVEKRVVGSFVAHRLIPLPLVVVVVVIVVVGEQEVKEIVLVVVG
jgi:hypothetical protein